MCLNKEKVAEIRAEIKKDFPSKKGWKFSIRNIDYRKLSITILAAPINFLEGKEEKYLMINPNYIIDEWEGEKKEALKKVNEIANNGNWNNSDPMIDYFDVGWYISLKIGDFERPFICKQA